MPCLPSPLYRVDKFIVPPQSLDRSLERVKKTHDALDQADGCERNLILEQFDGPGQFNVVTFVQWRDEAAYKAARQAALARQTAEGFDPQAFIKELGVMADIAVYRSGGAVVA